LGEQYALTHDHPCCTLAKRLLRHQDELFQFVLGPGLPADDPTRLASRHNILTTFRAHLAENQKIRPADSVVIYYSGHGARVPDSEDDEEDGWDETIVPCDVGPDRDNPADVLDITDDEIAALLDELGERTKDISLIFDSCHSGTVTRALFDAEGEEGEGQTRWLPPATCEVQRPHRHAITHAMGPAAWLPLSDNYTVISACRATEFAGEDPFWLSYVPPERKWHGVLTYFLLKALQDLAQDSTYRDIWPPVQASTHQKRSAQTPQIEGALDRKVFGGAERPRMRQVNVTTKEADTVTLAAGVVHGATIGSRYAIYKPGTTVFEDIKKRVARAPILDGALQQPDDHRWAPERWPSVRSCRMKVKRTTVL
jgi:hypothetical protein